MNFEELCQIFENKLNEKTISNEPKVEKGYMCEPGDIEKGLYSIRALDIDITLKNKSEIGVFCGEKEVIDISTRYIGLGNTIIEPIEDIENIEIKWR